tara:strand:- start:309 stop:791 length:483 start_codon:yes stop_codon:yes gene_type:complete
MKRRLPPGFKMYNNTPPKDNTLLELLIISLICFCLGFAFFINPKSEPQIESEPSMETFEQYPLQAWQSVDVNNGECVKVRYRVQKENTRLYMINSKGKLVHQTPLSLDPYKNKDRIETYVWKLYRTEWSSQIPPGEYQIIVGTDYDRSPTRNLNIEIDIQ